VEEEGQDLEKATTTDSRSSLKRKLAEVFEISSSQESNPGDNTMKCSKTTKPLRLAAEGRSKKKTKKSG